MAVASNHIKTLLLYLRDSKSSELLCTSGNDTTLARSKAKLLTDIAFQKLSNCKKSK